MTVVNVTSLGYDFMIIFYFFILRDVYDYLK